MKKRFRKNTGSIKNRSADGFEYHISILLRLTFLYGSADIQLHCMENGNQNPQSLEIRKPVMENRYVGLSQMEKQVKPETLLIDHLLFQRYFSEFNPSVANSDIFAASFKRGFSKATGIPQELLYEPKKGKQFDLSGAKLLIENKIQYQPAMAYDRIKKERQLALQKLRDILNSDQRFVQFYVAHTSEFQNDSENYFRSLVENEPDAEKLMEKYHESEKLAGELCAYYCIQEKLLRDELNRIKKEENTMEELPYEQKEGYKILKIALAQRWYKSELNHEMLPGEIREVRRKKLEPQTDEAFGKLIDHLMKKYGGNVFETMVDTCLTSIHHDSTVYGIHSDANTFVREDTQLAIEEAGDIYPFFEQDLEKERVINIEFLPGSVFFWNHMREKYPAEYSRLIGILEKRLASGYSGPSFILQMGGVNISASKKNSLYRILEKNTPQILPIIPETGQYKNQPESYLELEMDYEQALTRHPMSRKLFLLNDQFDSLF